MVANGNTAHILIDVRPSVEYDICSLPNSISILDNNIVYHYHLDNLLISHCLHFIVMETPWNYLLVTLVTISLQVNITCCYGDDCNICL